MSKIAIRVDANEIIATGHVMRSLTIANALRRHGADVRFISADNGVRPYVSKENFNLYILGSDWNDMDSEVADLVKYLQAEDIHKIFVDSYQVSEHYFQELSNAGISVTYIDDLCKKAYPVDRLVNYCPAAVSLGYEAMYADRTELRLGSAYIPLRDQFRDHTCTDGQGLLITAGGSDSMRIADKIIHRILNERGLGFADGPKGRLHLLAGRFYNPSEEILSYVSDGRLILHQNVDNVAEIMAGCRAAISSAGTTLFELSSVGVPTASFVFVDNQMTDALYFDREGLMPYIGDFRVSENRCLERMIDWLYEIGGVSSEERMKRGRRLREMIDGRGADRIAEALVG
ncbi:MAG: UDP-2,4-diacetamido-2,4,6-trideoxy-beta-L-altropyranose hydrolase [Lachnospiraceae bacterium]|nr:UDP-2,4-diacetamido-2,4,6-trideoxy-beta-L-altropyranose hydrolase [Lachnospiraceae bacterium]